MTDQSFRNASRILFFFLIPVIIVLNPITEVPSQGFDTDIISYWRFDDGEGQIASDSVGTSDGIIYGATWTAGIVGGALNFDGVDDYVLFTNFKHSSATLIGWFKFCLKVKKKEAYYV